MSVIILRGDARSLPLPDGSVDLIVTSPPYFGLRDYRDGDASLAGQIGSEATPAEYVAALLECTAEWARVLKPDGSMFVNLGDKYSQRVAMRPSSHQHGLFPGRPELQKDWKRDRAAGLARMPYENITDAETGRYVREKSLIGLPWRYALACTDELGLILRRDVIWSKPNGLPESVTDRCRTSHEYVFHLVKRPRYYAAVDEIREPHAEVSIKRAMPHRSPPGRRDAEVYNGQPGQTLRLDQMNNPLGKLPGSVWEISSQPLTVPPGLGVDHFACMDAETEIMTRRGWLRHGQLRDDDEVAGCDLDSGITRWTRLHGIHRYDYDGELVAAEARGLSMRLTPNHRVLAHRHAGRHKYRQPVEVIRADALTVQHSIPRAVQWAEDGREKPIGADLAALLGWVAAEGWYSANRNLVYLSQSQTVNAAKVEEITALLARLGDDPLRTERGRMWRGRPWRDVQWRLGRMLGAEVLRLMPDKLLPAWLADLPLAEARALLDAFIDGDGHRRANGRISVFQKDRRNLDALQAVAVRLGYNTTLRENGGRWVLYLNPPRTARLRRADGTSLVGREHYRGTVWCVTTGTGTFVARRNGTVFVTGNSFPMELPRRIIAGWSPPGICTACGEGRRPVTGAVSLDMSRPQARRAHQLAERGGLTKGHLDALLSVGISDTGRGAATQNGTGKNAPEVYVLAAEARAALGGYAREYLLRRPTSITYACACPEPDAPTRPALVTDPFGGTGTTALVADALGRHGISFDRSADYCRLARWRTTDPAERAKALQVPKPPPVPDGQGDLFTSLEAS